MTPDALRDEVERRMREETWMEKVRNEDRYVRVLSENAAVSVAVEMLREERARAETRPIIVTLCGSTRFYEAWQQAIYDETMAMRIVLSVGFYPHAAEKAHAAHVGCTPEQKVKLDDLHLRKIDLSDEILVLNVGGYIGESTRREIEYAKHIGKRVRWLEPESVK